MSAARVRAGWVGCPTGRGSLPMVVFPPCWVISTSLVKLAGLTTLVKLAGLTTLVRLAGLTTPVTLVALTLMIAESRPDEKDVMVRVVVNLINQQN